MNMHGIMVPSQEPESLSRAQQIRDNVIDWIVRKRVFLLVVVVPTALVAGYFYLIASNQYQSEAHFLVRSNNQSQNSSIGLSQAISAATGISSAQSEAMSVADYLTSHDVVTELQNSVGLRAMFQRPGVDLLSRLHGDKPTPERLLKFYRDHVTVKFSTETGITTIEARTFRPEDSYAIVSELMTLGEARVNVLNSRSYRDTLASASKELATTEAQLAQIQDRLTRFRQDRRDIDPQASGTAQMTMITQLNGDLTRAQAQLAAMGRSISLSSPQYIAMANRVRALQAQIAAQSSRLTGSSSAIAIDISGYEDLRMRQDFLAKRFASAQAGLDRARDQAQRQQLYIVRVVEPNMPVKSQFPHRSRFVITVLLALLITYALGWLLVAGVREHAN